jgi:hypothetical protein
MFSFFGLVIGIFSILLSRTFGLLGLLMPSAMVGFGYLLVDTIIVELYYINQDRNRHL